MSRIVGNTAHFLSRIYKNTAQASGGNLAQTARWLGK
jgi:hypothetical protein